MIPESNATAIRAANSFPSIVAATKTAAKPLLLAYSATAFADLDSTTTASPAAATSSAVIFSLSATTKTLLISTSFLQGNQPISALHYHRLQSLNLRCEVGVHLLLVLQYRN